MLFLVFLWHHVVTCQKNNLCFVPPTYTTKCRLIGFAGQCLLITSIFAEQRTSMNVRFPQLPLIMSLLLLKIIKIKVGFYSDVCDGFLKANTFLFKDPKPDVCLWTSVLAEVRHQVGDALLEHTVISTNRCACQYEVLRMQPWLSSHNWRGQGE